MEHETLIRLGFFFGILLAMAAWETASPKRRPRVSRLQRWSSNLSLVALNTVLVRLLLPAGTVGVAVLAESRGWGLLNILALPEWTTVVLAVVVLDLIIYTQHVIFHAVPMLWRLHMVHHADPDIDVTTGLRFHPVEIILSMLIKMGAVILLGAPVLAVVIFEVLLNATAMFNHGNVRLPSSLDTVLRLFVVTPDMHRVHHSIIKSETNSNYGFNLPWWDRLFGTYRAQPQAGHLEMTIGLSQYQNARRQGLAWMLSLPFTGQPGDYPRHRSSSG